MPRDTVKLGPGSVLDAISGGTGIDASELPAGKTLRSLGNEGGWEAADQAAGAVLQSIYAESVVSVLSQKQIPFDDTIPQITEGEEILTATITPGNALNRLRVCFQTWGNTNSAVNNAMMAALFRDAVADALTAVASTYPGVIGDQHVQTITLIFQEVAGDVIPRTYRVRIGQALAPDAGNTVRLLGDVGRLFGGVARSTLTIEELAP